MLRQDVVQEVAQYLRAGHSTDAIVSTLRRRYPQEDIDDAFAAVGARTPIVGKHHTHNVFAKFIFILVIAIVVGLVLGSITYGIIKFKAKMDTIAAANAKEQAGNTPASPASSSSPAPPSAPASPPSASAPVKTLPPPQAKPDTTLVASSDQALPDLLPVGFGRCALMQDDNSPDSRMCRREEALKLSGPNDCNTVASIKADPRIYEQCSRAFFEMAQTTAQQPS